MLVSILHGFFPEKTATDQKASDLNESVNVLKSEQSASLEAPTTREGLESILDKGKL